MEHLFDVGYRRIAFLGDLMGIAAAADRYQCYTDALRAAEIALDDRLRANVPGPAPRLEESRVYGSRPSS